MMNRLHGVVAILVVVIAVASIAFGGFGQREKVAVFVQAAAPVPASDLEIVGNYANQRFAVITGSGICSQGELMYAQRITNTYVSNSITVNGMRQLTATLGVEHVIILRIVRWEKQLSYVPERSLLLLGATSFLNTSLQVLISPLGLLMGIEKEATVGLLATVFSPQGDIEFSTTVTYEDRPLLSLLTADPVEAAKGAIDSALYQLAVAL